MCLAVPGKVIEAFEFSAEVEVMGNKMKVETLLVPEIKKDDYVLIHAGQAIEIIDSERAELSLESWEQILNES